MKKLLLAGAVCIGLISVAAAQKSERDDLGAGAAAEDSPYGTAPGGPNGQMGPPPNAMFNAIDTDGDGEITTRELRKAVASLKKLDVDKDGKITRAETLNNQVANSGAVVQPGFGSQPQFGGAAGGVNGDPRQGPNIMQYDRNGDGQLSADEVPTQMRGMLRGADLNSNGQLDPSEVQNIQQRMNERVRGQRNLPPGVSVGPQGVQGVGQKP